MNLSRACGLAALTALVVAGAGIAQPPADAPSPANVVTTLQAPKLISFGSMAFDPVRSTPPGDRHATAANGKGLRLMQFTGPVRPEWLGDLRSAGVRPLQYYPHDTFLVWTDDSAARAAAALPQVRWQGRYLAEWKIEDALAKRSGLISNVGVHFHNDGDIDGVLAALRAAGADVLNHGPAQTDRLFHDAWIRIDASRLPALAELPQVVWLEYASPQPILDDEMSSQILARNYDAGGVPQLGYLPWLGALGYDGSGLTWAIIDSGVDYTHPDFAGRIVGGVTYGTCPPGNGPGDDPSSGGHGTHVAGIVGGTGAAGFTDAQGFAYGVGMAPGVGFFAQNPICAGGQSWPPTGGWQRLSKDALAGGAIGGNASWTSGESGGTTYTAGARAWDQIVRDGDFDTPLNEAFMFVFSAGNSGPGAGTLTAPKAAKNPIITGGTQNFRVSGNIDAVYNSSSRGPTQDGRYGITIAAPAQTIASARRIAGASQCSTAIAGTNNHYAFCTGTSMAAPHTSGTAVLLSDWWRDHNGGAIPSPAMIKALLVNGAKDYGGGGAIPNTTQGWGRIDLPGSMGLDVQYSEYLDQTVVFDSVDQVHEVTFGVPESDKPLKITLAWTDAAAAVAANPALVNNLDLEVDTGGQTYLGNVFSAGMSTTGGSADTLNNVENVFVAEPGDSVTIRVIARNLPGDGIPGVGAATDQDFALVCSNCVESEGFSLAVDPASQAVCAPDPADYAVTIGSILGYDEPVTLSVSGVPAGASAQFSTNPVVPPGSSALQIGDTDAAAAGDYTLEITGTSIDQTRSVERSLVVATATPGLPLPQSPANDAQNVGLTPTLEWMGASQAGSYRVQIAADAGFTAPLLDEVVTGDSFEVPAALASSSTYYWRVQADNACGSGAWSPVFRFQTQSAVGDCTGGASTVTVFSEDFSGGLGAFSTAGSTGASTWAISNARPGSPSGGNTLLAVDIPTVSDQRLTSPPIVLPADLPAQTLQFWNDQTIELRTAGGCWDGGLLEITTNAGATWTQVPDSAIANRPYDGLIGTGWSNPIENRPAWCGDPRAWENYIIDLDDYAGETVQFRWRLGTDSTTGRAPHGWYLDDIRVQGCAAGKPPVADADLNVAIAAAPDPVFAGETLTYLVQVGNAGPDPATGVQLSLVLPADAAFAGVAAGAPAWDCAHAAGTVTCDLLGVLPDGATAPDLDIEVTVSAAAASGTMTAVATVGADDNDPVPANNEASVATQVIDPSEFIFAHGFECGDDGPGCD